MNPWKTGNANAIDLSHTIYYLLSSPVGGMQMTTINNAMDSIVELNATNNAEIKIMFKSIENVQTTVKFRFFVYQPDNKMRKQFCMLSSILFWYTSLALIQMKVDLLLYLPVG